MSTILVPIDFSDASRSSALYAASLAKKLNSKLLLFHAYMLPTPVSEVPYVLVSVDELQAENEKLIRREAETLQVNFGIEVDSLVQIGMPAEEITAVAEEKGATLTVIGMRGAGTIDKLIGSTTASVVRKSTTPVLVVPYDVVFAPVTRIVYASDLSYASSQARFSTLITIGRQFNAQLHVIHVQKSAGSAPTAEEAKAKAGIAGLLAPLNPSFSEISDDSISHGIKTYIEQNQSQMLVMVAHKHNFFERLFSKIHTTEMAYDTKVPLLVLQ